MEFSISSYPSHGKGKETRLEILSAVVEFPSITPELLAKRIGKSKKQTVRHLQQLVAEGKLKKFGIGYVITN